MQACSDELVVTEEALCSRSIQFIARLRDCVDRVREVELASDIKKNAFYTKKSWMKFTFAISIERDDYHLVQDLERRISVLVNIKDIKIAYISKRSYQFTVAIFVNRNIPDKVGIKPKKLI